MFNGGTRKRLLSRNDSPLQIIQNATSTHSNTNSTSKINNKPSNFQRHQEQYTENKESNETISAKRLKTQNLETNQNPVLGESAVPATVGAVNPINVASKISQQTKIVSNSQNSVRDHELATIIPLSRNFMMDYMWHAHAAHHQQHNKSKLINASTFNFPNCNIPWRKDNYLSTVTSLSTKYNNVSNFAATNSPLSICSNPTKNLNENIDHIPQIINNSAFKPVHHQQQNKLNSISPKMATVESELDDLRNENSLSSNIAVLPKTESKNKCNLPYHVHNYPRKVILSSAGTYSCNEPGVLLSQLQITSEMGNVKASYLSECDRDYETTKDDDDEVVDIETTEDEGPDQNIRLIPNETIPISRHTLNNSPNNSNSNSYLEISCSQHCSSSSTDNIDVGNVVEATNFSEAKSNTFMQFENKVTYLPHSTLHVADTDCSSNESLHSKSSSEFIIGKNLPISTMWNDVIKNEVRS
ncbi:uncharacterized protein LOC119675227 [Teleopsis dalmanni]|uniref:uncharacterized protein LOC119675227 n=1 Tax=Teleopsis dalmanni TaxID=139649 RepID=UPI0018CE2002|nr:uncharacterized protein LOC119675227 [Teleopsis dalmanni]